MEWCGWLNPYRPRRPYLKEKHNVFETTYLGAKRQFFSSVQYFYSGGVLRRPFFRTVVRKVAALTKQMTAEVESKTDCDEREIVGCVDSFSRS
jgi:hypothetical protein